MAVRDIGGGWGRWRWRVVVVALVTVAGSPTPASAPAVATGEFPSPVVGAEQPVTANAQQRRFVQAHNSPVLAVDPTEERFVALASRVDAIDFGCALQVSGDGGGSWVPARPVPKLPEDAEKCYAPEVGFDGDGVLYYLFLGLRGTGNFPMGAFLVTSVDRGRTFTAPRQVLGPNSFQVRMAIDPAKGGRGRIHLVWLQVRSEPGTGSLPAPPNPIVAAHSDDGGQSFTAPVVVAGGGGERVVAPAVGVGEDHALHVAYYDLGDDARDYQGLEGPAWDGFWSLVVSTSVDGGAGFGPAVVVEEAIVPPARVMLIFTMAPAALAADGAGRLHAAWTDARHGDPDVLLRTSGDGGRSWAAPRRLNDDGMGNGRHQSLPRLAVSPEGRLDAIFYDRRDDPADRHNDVYYTFSSDGGTRFAPNLKLTTKPSDATIGQRYELVPSAQGQVEFGSRLGLLSRADGVVAAWADTRNSTHPVQQDIFSTVVGLPQTRPGRAPWAVPAGVITLGLAGAVMVSLRRRRHRAAR